VAGASYLSEIESERMVFGWEGRVNIRAENSTILRFVSLTLYF
jgi:hypothetical protein